MSIPRILVVTNCTGEKRFKQGNQLTLSDFKDSSLLMSRSKQLNEFACSAGEMYTGVQHLRLMEGVNLLRQAGGINGNERVLTVDVAIISAGYGLINEHKMIVPYEVTFNTMKGQEVDEWAHFLGIHDAFEQLISDYNLIFILLGENYLRALNLPVKTNSNQTFIFLASWGSSAYIKVNLGKTFVFPLSNAEAKYYGYGLVGLKGFLFKQFAQLVHRDGQLISKLLKNPEFFKEVIDRLFEQEKSCSVQLTLPLLGADNLRGTLGVPHPLIDSKNKLKTQRSEISEVIPLPLISPAPNYHHGMKYFIPEWDDYVDPTFDFIQDKFTSNRVPHKDDIYAHQLFESPNYDGILVSKVVFDKSQKKQQEILDKGIHDYIRYSGEIMGDCGAFGYIQKEVPPYTTEEILDYYQSCGFNYGVSIDHLVVGKFAEPGIREKRYNLTIKNAEEFLTKHSEYGCQFIPVGAIQGWNPQTYAEAVKAYIKMGYTYLALGGLAREKVEKIIEILLAIYPYLQPDIRLHLFGVGRLNAVPIFRHLGVTSFDSASPLRKAWLDPEANYHGVNHNIYAAIRIPQANHKNKKIKELIKFDLKNYLTSSMIYLLIITSFWKWEMIQFLEQGALKVLRDFDDNQAYIDVTLETVLTYNHLFLKDRLLPKYRLMYQTLLEDKPWKDCDCVICQSLGVETLIFRGNDRNRRRGFHNTYMFYKPFQAKLEEMRAII
ncbi:tRNA-guanine transglycosylase DpdA [Crocosphaera sp. XPORK-15E]|uniref:tRNA-guanine transglycosylase DpdA n=1 Tax=Crocosphaera sp. XPORK-15E TaxID=3110247 RepID=UPI002B1ED027|nr:tRNA-guanine transglycosylase DpdA [Crocosphaera sp. XPORK-15E]MEA5536671.1 tRNA-guanine transglycosylase DpdA [Crocosphaera sp. XPORK-15E]